MLFDAVTRNDLEALSGLLAAGADINETTERGSHILFRAVIKAQSLDVVELLLEARADVRASDMKGNTVMHFWARATVGRNHLVDIGAALVKAGANIDSQRTTDGMSPLHHVAIGHNNRRGWLDFHKAVFLIRSGANVGILTQRGQTPLALLQQDSRTATRKLTHLLSSFLTQPGVGPPNHQIALGLWPHCEHPGCGWCPPVWTA